MQRLVRIKCSIHHLHGAFLHLGGQGMVDCDPCTRFLSLQSLELFRIELLGLPQQLHRGINHWRGSHCYSFDVRLKCKGWLYFETSTLNTQ